MSTFVNTQKVSFVLESRKHGLRASAVLVDGETERRFQFDGRADSIYHRFDRAGNRHMEYVNMRGAFDDMPLDLIVAGFEKTYPAMMADMNANQAADFAADAARETR